MSSVLGAGAEQTQDMGSLGVALATVPKSTADPHFDVLEARGSQKRYW